MDDELQQLEEELGRLRPRAPSAFLAGRVEQALARPRPASVAAWRWIVLPAAAAITVLVAVLPSRRTQGPASAKAVVSRVAGPVFRPVAAQNVLLASRDEGFVTLEDGTRARRTRRTYLDSITWRDSRTNASLTWTLPREEVRVVPIAFQ